MCPVPDENNFVTVYKCDVTMHVGNPHDLGEGTLATVIISENDVFSPSNNIERIASHVRLSFFRDIFYQEITEPSQSLLDKIRFLSHTPAQYSNKGHDEWREYWLIWNDLTKSYNVNLISLYSGYYSTGEAKEPDNMKPVLRHGEVSIA